MQPITATVLSLLAFQTTQFDLDLYHQLQTQPGNLFLSPASISTALAMTQAGARGETAQQMTNILRLTEAKRASVPASGEGYRLNIANRLWGQQGYHFVPDFLAVTRDSFGAELGQVDFMRQTDQARQTIKLWVEQQTQDRIKDLIPNGVLDPTTRLVLTNAIYFKGDWATPFQKAATQQAPFHLAAGKTVPVPLMQQLHDFRFWAGDGLKALELPYGRGDLTMIVLLPEKVGELPALEAKLTEKNLTTWLAGLRRQKVQVFLPRFQMSSQFSLNETLKAMGMTLAFSDKADFSGISTQDKLQITAVIHKAFIDVNEEGTEAAAATGVAVGLTSALPQKPVEFRADHPFAFMIRDNRSGNILFVGRLINPQG